MADFHEVDVVKKYATKSWARHLIARRALLDLMGHVKGKRIIDIGCGAGDLTAAAHEAGAALYGVDASEEFIALARASHPHIPFDHRDARSMPDVETASFDGAVMFMVTFSMKDRTSLSALFREAARILKPGGHLYYCTVHPLMIHDHECPLWTVTLPAGAGYQRSEMTTRTRVLLTNGDWLELIDHHWKLEDVTREMFANNMAIVGLSEPSLTADHAQDPLLEPLTRQPFYMLLKAEKRR